VHAHPLVRSVLLDQARRLERANHLVAGLWTAAIRNKSGWTNAVQPIATQLQQNLEVRDLLGRLLVTSLWVTERLNLCTCHEGSLVCVYS